MAVLPRRAPKAELDALEARMGELAALLSEVADALTSYPESIRVLDEAASMDRETEAAIVALRAGEWPSVQDIDQLLANWRQLRELTDRAGG